MTKVQLVVFLVCSLILEGSCLCPNNSFEWQSNCYLFIEKKTTFADAELQCVYAGGHLTSLHDSLTSAILAQKAGTYLHGMSKVDFWIGANNIGNKQPWGWTDGTSFDFSDWKKGEPRNSTSGLCGTLSPAHGYWLTYDCVHKAPFVCTLSGPSTSTTSRPTTLRTSTLKTTTRAANQPSTRPSIFQFSSTASTRRYGTNCDAGWSFFNGYCYSEVSSTKQTFDAAELNCQYQGAHLPSIHSYDEITFVDKYLIRVWAPFWLGLYSIDGGMYWNWSDGTSYDYQQWYSSPSVTSGKRCGNLNSGNRQDCSSNCGYYSVDCNTASYYICKKPAY